MCYGVRVCSAVGIVLVCLLSYICLRLFLLVLNLVCYPRVWQLTRIQNDLTEMHKEV